MTIRTNSDEHWIVKKLRGHEKEIENLKEEREGGNVDRTLIRRVDETAISSVNVTVTVDDSPGLVYDSGDRWDGAEYLS